MPNPTRRGFLAALGAAVASVRMPNVEPAKPPFVAMSGVNVPVAPAPAAETAYQGVINVRVNGRVTYGAVRREAMRRARAMRLTPEQFGRMFPADPLEWPHDA